MTLDVFSLVVWGLGSLTSGILGLAVGIKIIEELLNLIGVIIPERIANFIWAMCGVVVWHLVFVYKFMPAYHGWLLKYGG